MYPVWIADSKTERPTTQIYYEIAANGIFLHKETPFWSATVPVPRISILNEEQPSITVKLPPIPERITLILARLFAWYSLEKHTEAMALLWWHTQPIPGYFITVPSQLVSMAGIAYKIPPRPQNSFLVGTFHSHGSLSAYHSETDQCDEKSMDGIHGTFGDLGSNQVARNIFMVSLQAVINGHRFPLDPEILMGGIKKSEDKYISGHRGRGIGYWLSTQEDVKASWYELKKAEKLLPNTYRPPYFWQRKIRERTFSETFKGRLGL